MRRARRLRAALLGAALGAALAWTAGAGEGTANDEDWGRLEHPDHPLSFEVPIDTSIGRVTVFSLGQPRTRDGRKVDVTLFGVQPRTTGSPEAWRPHYRELEFGFFWVTEDYRGAEAARLAALAREIKRPDKVEAFLRSVFYRDASHTLTDLGAEIVAGYPARRSAVERRIAAGTSAERVVRGEVLVVAVSRTVALVVVGRFGDEQAPATDESSRRRIFQRVLRSLHIAGSGAHST